MKKYPWSHILSPDISRFQKSPFSRVQQHSRTKRYLRCVEFRRCIESGNPVYGAAGEMFSEKWPKDRRHDSNVSRRVKMWPVFVKSMLNFSLNWKSYRKMMQDDTPVWQSLEDPLRLDSTWSILIVHCTLQRTNRDASPRVLLLSFQYSQSRRKSCHHVFTSTEMIFTRSIFSFCFRSIQCYIKIPKRTLKPTFKTWRVFWPVKTRNEKSGNNMKQP